MDFKFYYKTYFFLGTNFKNPNLGIFILQSKSRKVIDQTKKLREEKRNKFGN